MPRLSSISASVRQLKNSFIPINRLPPEVLALVPTFRESERDLIRATAVCRHWRRSLIYTPSLWTKIACSKRERTHAFTPHVQAYLERFGSVPIDVQIHARAFRLLACHTGRISSLRMFLNAPVDFEEIAERFSKPAPILKAISLRVNVLDDPTLDLPSTFLEPFRSSVRELALHGTILSPCKFPQVTRFTLIANHYIGVPSAVLLDTLEQMPLLRFFEATYTRLPEVIPGIVWSHFRIWNRLH